MDYSNFYKSKNVFKETNQIPKDKTKFYEYWVRQFICQHQRHIYERVTVKITRYLEYLKSNSKVDPWQVAQAEDAVYLFVNNILNLNINNKGSTVD